MSEPLDFRRSPGGRETAVVVAGIVAGPLVLLTAWRLVEAWRDGAVWVAVLVTLLWLALVWVCAPFWQLLLAPAEPDDVVLRLDDDGWLLTDAGYRIRVPWTSIARVRLGAGPTVVPVVDGPVDRSWDPLARSVARGLRRGTLRIRVPEDDPDLDRLVAAVPRFTGGRVTVERPPEA